MPIARTPIAERLWRRVEKTDTCWNWTGNRDPLGYGRITTGGKYGSLKLVHRVAYEELVGPIPDGFALDHLCSNPSCVNPAHLEPVTQKENIRRAYERLGRKPGPGTLKTHCPRGHAYEGTNVIRTKKGHRICRICNNESAKLRARSRRALLRSLRD